MQKLFILVVIVVFIYFLFKRNRDKYLHWYQSKNNNSKLEQKFENMFRKHSSIMLLIDPKNSNIIDINDSAIKFYGYEYDKIIGKSLATLNTETLENIQEKALKATKLKQNTFIGKHKLHDGTLKTVEISSSPIEIENEIILFSIIKDITEVQKLQDEVNNQKKELESIFNSAQVAIAVIDLKTNFLNCNDTFLKIIGYTKEELLKKSCSELTAAEDREINSNAINEALEKGYVNDIIKNCVTADKKHITVNMSISLLPDKQRFILVIQDITQMKITEEQKRLASMGEMIGNIAHHWRQPLSVISTGASGMKVQKEYNILTDESFYKVCDAINENAQYLSKTIDYFANFVRGNFEPIQFDLEKNIQSFLTLIDSSTKKNNIQFIIDVEKNSMITGLPNELIQCFVNMFNNSKEAFIVKDIQENTRYIFISLVEEDNSIRIIFKDNAGGISEKNLQKVFEPYFTMKHKSQGTGLGLSMSYRVVVHGMKGTLTVHNEEYKYKGEEYKGACFTITLKR